MITNLTIENFKSLLNVKLELGRLNLFVGPNASGKSNLIDSFRVLQGVGHGYTIDEIFNGKPKTASSEVWEGIRGGSTGACFGKSGSEELTLAARTVFGDRHSYYCLATRPATGTVTSESLDSPTSIYQVDRNQPHLPLDGQLSVRYTGMARPREAPQLVHAKSNRPVVLQLPKLVEPMYEQATRNGEPTTIANDIQRATDFAIGLTDMQYLNLQPVDLRDYVRGGHVHRLGERGEGFAGLVRAICADESTRKGYLGWLQHLRPDEIEDVGVLKGAVDDYMFMLKEGGHEYPAAVLSDGTLRFAALTAAFFQLSMPGIMLIEEIENGIHPERLRLVLELLRTQAGQKSTQIIATTHSPVILSWLQEEEYAHTFFCKRDPETGESIIRPLTEIPRFLEVIKKRPLEALFMEGWLEAAL